MGRINRLDEHLSNMIAAGEVVERPQGIVKELVENCIDAHASNIEIQISQGGIATITIIDDGDGMDPEDATLAFERHATSKLKEVNDLWNIHTMGFRGEHCLPSHLFLMYCCEQMTHKLYRGGDQLRQADQCQTMRDSEGNHDRNSESVSENTGTLQASEKSAV